MITCYLWRTLKRTLSEWIAVPFGLCVYTAIRKKGCSDILICDHIGDFLYTVGYLKAYKQVNGIMRLRVISTERFSVLEKYYPGAFDEYKVVSKRRLKWLLFPYHYRLGRQAYQGMGVKVVEPASDFADRYEYVTPFPGLTLKDCICYGVLRLPFECRMDKPVWYRENKSERNRPLKVFLSPFAAVTRWEPYLQLFRQLSITLTECGYKVFKNQDDNSAIQGTCIKGNLDDFMGLAEQMDWVIGIRSGLLDLAALIGCRVIALYPREDKMTSYFDLQRMSERKEGIWQYRMLDNTKEDVRNLLEFLEGADRCR